MRKIQRYMGDIFLLVHHLGKTKAKELYLLYLPSVSNLPIWKKGRAEGTQSLPGTPWYEKAAVVLH